MVDESVFLRTASGERCWPCPAPLSEGSHHPDWFAGVADDFCAAVSVCGKDNLDEALLCARVIDLAQRSSAAGGIRLSLDT